MRNLTSLASGLLFGLGLILSDMVNPDRVRAFLDIFGAWDPTLAFVMGGAIVVSAAGWIIARRRSAALFGGAMPPPPSPTIDRELIGGSALFGIGWGMIGLCPGPVVAALAFAPWQVPLFMLAMLLGMWLYNQRQSLMMRAQA
ncbi:hypothetical protein LGT41_0008015 [Abyssibius alkaniclasticus]|uniref:DUF6691 family protein n=1 Tax=Abyssibius alkaniclasticus TaxID=2881234 RepID=UPI002363D998|nr:DUF6691 family protein [Abyssibius alkaniclasticus]UPH69775.1 hypothetical protein LGT41_0008015 [Abyssibius alkaniclasticus]|tara:strand:+ start:589 stop:1017 length:429 start_codon:yes stop_codon:yes gene_type:complete